MITNKEAITYFKRHLDLYCVDGISRESEEMAIKALEQEPVLEKIMKEIEQVKSIMNEEIINNNRKDLIDFVNGLNQSLVIIDKYKSESEER